MNLVLFIHILLATAWIGGALLLFALGIFLRDKQAQSNVYDYLGPIYGYFEKESGNPLVVIPTAGGKSLVMAAFIDGVLPRLRERGVNLDVYYIASVELFDRLSEEERNAILPPEVILWQHTHDTASMAVSCYMAGIEGGAFRAKASQPVRG